jgi:3-oxoacyl-[acyl-carrier protein] reductase
MRLKDKVAIVTGGGFGIGSRYSLGLAREGARVVVADVNEQGMEETLEALESEGADALSVRTDVSNEASTRAMVDAAIRRFGRVDVLVNNAALFTALPLRDWEDISIEEWDNCMAVNLRGPFLCSRAVAPHMKQRNYGKIINISSASVFSGNPRRAHYVTSKMGLIGFTRSLAQALGKYNICVNSILPGSTASEGTREAYGADHFTRVPAGRAIPRVQIPEDLVGTVVFLASSDSDFITGQALVVDGGVAMY